jgi:hypothetical protein
MYGYVYMQEAKIYLACMLHHVASDSNSTVKMDPIAVISGRLAIAPEAELRRGKLRCGRRVRLEGKDLDHDPTG